MTLAVDSIRWDVLGEHVRKNAPNKPMTDHPSMNVDGQAVLYREGVCTDTTIQQDPFLTTHMVIGGDIESATEVSSLELDPVRKQGLLLMSNKSIAVIGEDATIMHVGIPDAKKQDDSEPEPTEPEMRRVATLHLNMHLQILRQMGII